MKTGHMRRRNVNVHLFFFISGVFLDYGVITKSFQLSSNESHSMDLNLTQGQCFTKCYSLLSLISFNLDALIKAECSEMKSYAKLIITDFNILIDVLMQIKILESQRTQKSVLETAFPYIGEFF